ncbi:hypothetical protein KFE25_001854 [Diacronema lutheri]|uniref:Aminoglycoside phosphotransferase domain-containing protein n=1 Tax=Diacronema lutheri TaxID=2081491 RepID=A0A8J5XCN2_DIALT|nr:hypothetical protein KFE25_001854 [Diacronema lutheri]
MKLAAARVAAAMLLAEIERRPHAAADVCVTELQQLWSGFGSVLLVNDALIVKEVRLPDRDLSYPELRDLGSHRVEAAFYERHAARLLAEPIALRVPKPLLVRADEQQITICMTRLDGEAVNGDLDRATAHAALETLAGLHAAYWGIGEAEIDGLHEHGSFWHLDARQAEFREMPHGGWEGRLRLAARALDLRLKADAMQTCVHGDPKDANFFFAPSGAQLFDFQWIGRAPPSKDLAYLFTCCARVKAPAVEAALLAHYHAALTEKLRAKGIEPPPLRAVRDSLQLAYADLARWMSGWEGGWWAKPLLSARTRLLLDELDGGTPLRDEQAYIDAVFARFPP